MSVDEMDVGRRKFITAATTVVGGIGVACASLPFILSWSPSEKARALGAPVDVDISKIEPGQKITVAWRGQPIFLVNRTNEMLTPLSNPNFESQLRDPKSEEPQQPKFADNIYRSIKENLLVVIGICTHLGCVPLFKPQKNEVEAGWEGGFFCPCHGSKYDLSGRVYKGVPAPLNLVVPPYQYLSDTIVRVGELNEKEGNA
jgi:ubiquinol-cytochrome c reductase iron-sulfur subunit